MPARRGALLMAAAPAASAHAVTPKSAPAFRDSVGVVTQSSTTTPPTATGRGSWPAARSWASATCATACTPTVAEWRDWNERYYRAVDLAAAHGMRFTFVMGGPGGATGTLDQLVSRRRRAPAPRGRGARGAQRVRQVRRRAAVGRRAWPLRPRSCTERSSASPSLRSVPVLGALVRHPRAAQLVGRPAHVVDVGNVHPYTGGLSPDPEPPAHRAGRRADPVSGRKPVWATEAGFHNALRRHRAGPAAGVGARRARSTCCAPSSSTSATASRRTYAYELIDEKPEPARA